MKSLFLIGWLISTMLLVSEVRGQDFHVTTGLRTSVIDWKSPPSFFPISQAFGLFWDFSPAVGYEAGLSRTISVGRFTFEPEVKYCRNTINQHIHLLNPQREIVSSTTFILNNNVAEIQLPLKEPIRINRNKVYAVLGPFGQFRKNERFRTEIGKGIDPVAEGERFSYGFVVGLEGGTKKIVIRLQGQFARTVFGGWATGYKGYTLAMNLRYNIGPLGTNSKRRHIIKS